MARATLSIIIPTRGRPSLFRTLQSAASQLGPGDEILVVGDTHSGPLPKSQDMAECYGARYIEFDAGRHAWGHPQINHGMKKAHGDYFVFNDDDDIFTPRAIHSIHSAIANSNMRRPHMFAFVSHSRIIRGVENVIREGWVGGHQIVVPNNAARFGQWTDRYKGDFDFVLGTVNKWGGSAKCFWHEDIIAICRPPVRLVSEYAREPSQIERVRRIRNSGRKFMTRDQSFISEEKQKRWWRGLQDECRNHLFLYREIDQENYVAYSYTQVDAGRAWVSLAVDPAYRRRGYGSEIYGLLTKAYSHVLWAEIAANNASSIKAALRGGFRKKENTDGKVLLNTEEFLHGSAGWVETENKTS